MVLLAHSHALYWCLNMSDSQNHVSLSPRRFSAVKASARSLSFIVKGAPHEYVDVAVARPGLRGTPKVQRLELHVPASGEVSVQLA